MANMQIKNVGDRAQPQWTFTVQDSNGDDIPTDPSQIIVRQQTAAGVESIVTTASTPSALTTSSTPLARVSVGVFKLNPGVSLTTSGYWVFRAEATGTAESAAPDFTYKVGPSEFTADAGLETYALVGLQETKDWLNQQNIETGDELELARAINDMSERIISATGRELRPFHSTPTDTREFDADQLVIYRRTVVVGDLASFTAVRILDSDGAEVEAVDEASDVISLPRNREPWEPIRRLKFTSDVTGVRWGDVVEVTGVWGFPQVPGSIRQAVLDSLAWVMDRDVEHYRQDFSPVPSGEAQNVIVLGGRQRVLALPPPAEAVVEQFRDLLVA